MGQTDAERRAVGEQGYQSFLQTLTAEHMRRAFFQSLGIDPER